MAIRYKYVQTCLIQRNEILYTPCNHSNNTHKKMWFWGLCTHKHWNVWLFIIIFLGWFYRHIRTSNLENRVWPECCAHSKEIALGLSYAAMFGQSTGSLGCSLVSCERAGQLCALPVFCLFPVMLWREQFHFLPPWEVLCLWEVSCLSPSLVAADC